MVIGENTRLRKYKIRKFKGIIDYYIILSLKSPLILFNSTGCHDNKRFIITMMYKRFVECVYDDMLLNKYVMCV